jgi:hypothetical protein
MSSHGARSLLDDNDDVFPLGDGPSLNELEQMEGECAFQCLDCKETFETVLDWGQHALDRHKDTFPGIKPVKKEWVS